MPTLPPAKWQARTRQQIVAEQHHDLSTYNPQAYKNSIITDESIWKLKYSVSLHAHRNCRTVKSVLKAINYNPKNEKHKEVLQNLVDGNTIEMETFESVLNLSYEDVLEISQKQETHQFVFEPLSLDIDLSSSMMRKEFIDKMWGI